MGRCVRRRTSPPAGAFVVAVAVVLFGGGLAGCGGGRGGSPVLGWYVNPDNGGQAELAAACTRAAGGRYRIRVSTLPTQADGQREQLVRRLAARDGSIALMSLDPPFVAEFAAAGFLRPFTPAEAKALTDGVLAAPVEPATWDGRLMAAPFGANAQLLWYRRSVAARAGLDPAAGPSTWEQLIGAAERTGTTVEVQGDRYEGYMVWISALVASAGGQVLAHPEAGRNAEPVIDSPAGRRAAEVIARLARSRAADPALSVAEEEATRAAFQSRRGGSMVNWPYAYGAAASAVADGSLDRSVLDDIGWARWPRVDADRPSRPPLGGISLAVGAFTPHQAEAVDAVRCLTTAESQRRYMLRSKNPVA